MSQLVRLEGKHSTQNAHCALVSVPVWLQLSVMEEKSFFAQFPFNSSFVLAENYSNSILHHDSETRKGTFYLIQYVIYIAILSIFRTHKVLGLEWINLFGEMMCASASEPDSSPSSRRWCASVIKC